MKWMLALLVVAAWVRDGAATTQVHYVMGTYLRVTVDRDVAPAALDGCFAYARQLDRAFSRFDPSSELTSVNASHGGQTSADFRGILGDALALARTTDGAFDVSVGALTSLWRRAARPSDGEIARAAATVGGVTFAGDTVELGSGTLLDFDGFAKGVAVDGCVARLRDAGIERALVSFGESSLYGLGAPTGRSGWELDVRGPDPDAVVACLRLRDEAASISAVYGGGGRRSPGEVGHIVDPRTGRPVSADAVGVIVAARAAEAEAFSKAVLVWGEAGVARAERSANVRAAWIAQDRVQSGAAMRRSGALVVFAHPRPLPAESGPR
jgi:thiamine biosynthesis lipoprotein